LLLKEIVDAGHYIFVPECDGWEDSIRKCCIPLIADGTVDGTYENTIIDCVKEHGPYIVLMPGYCLPHAMQGAKGVHKTAIGFMKCEMPVVFDPADPEKYATVFFTLAAENEKAHMRNMKMLFGMLTNEDLLAELQNVHQVGDLLELDKKYFS
jgi:ascorbate PTS system EIIA or EIIAB component